MSFTDAMARLGDPTSEMAYWKKTDGNVLALSHSGDGIISSVSFHPKKTDTLGLSQQQWWAIGLAILGILLGFLVLPSEIKGWRSIVLTTSVPTLYGLAGAFLSVFAWEWFYLYFWR